MSESQRQNIRLEDARSMTREVSSVESKEPIENPLPFWQTWTICMVAFVNMLNMVIIFPFLPFFTAQFYPDIPTNALGGYVGILASAYFFGDVIGSLIWGPFADKFGRKPAVQIGLVTSIQGMLLFPFSPTFNVAVLIRFLTGLLCGNNSLTRTMMSESCDSTNQARGFSMIGMGTGLARLFAPGIGGILALPVTKFPSFFSKGGVNERFPFFLPCLVGAIQNGIGQTMAIFLLKETLETQTTEEETLIKTTSTAEASQDKESAWDVVMQPTVLLIMVVYFFHSFVGVSSHEIIPIWVINSPADHGFNMDTTEVGLILSLVAPFQVIFQAFIYPAITQRLKFIGMFKWCSIIYGATIISLPYISLLAGYPKYVLWPIFIIAMGVTNCSRIGAFTCIFVLLSNSCHKNVRASVNGIGQAVSSSGRMFGPTVTGASFAWSLNNHLPYPFNYHFSFILLGAMCIVSYQISLFFNPVLDYQKDSKEATEFTNKEVQKAKQNRSIREIYEDSSDDEDDITEHTKLTKKSLRV